MSATARTLAAGTGWRARDIICEAGPGDRAFEERHELCSVALVTRGSFRYRSVQGEALLAPGAILLGNAGACFECGHEHAAGDRCLAFQFQPEFMESIARGLPGVRRLCFRRPHLPPSLALARLQAEAETAMDDPEALEEIALRLAAAALTVDADGEAAIAPSASDTRRVTRALRQIEAGSQGRLGLARLAASAAMSPYHFLRCFRAVVGMTPHQYLLRTRLHRAALAIRRTAEPITTIALEAGFGDLSTFNRRFRSIMGASPRAYRARPLLQR